MRNLSSSENIDNKDLTRTMDANKEYGLETRKESLHRNDGKRITVVNDIQDTPGGKETEKQGNSSARRRTKEQL